MTVSGVRVRYAVLVCVTVSEKPRLREVELRVGCGVCGRVGDWDGVESGRKVRPCVREAACLLARR